MIVRSVVSSVNDAAIRAEKELYRLYVEPFTPAYHDKVVASYDRKIEPKLKLMTSLQWGAIALAAQRADAESAEEAAECMRRSHEQADMAQDLFDEINRLRVNRTYHAIRGTKKAA